MEKQLRVLFFTLLLLLFGVTFCLAQTTVVAEATPATCSANGTIAIAVTGGASPYQYEIIAPTAGIRPPQNSAQFLNLAPATYTVKVTDSQGATKTATATVLDQYDEPTLNCSLTNNSVTLTTQNGKAPFTYQAFLNGGTTPVRATSNTQDRTVVFNCLTNGDYAFKITDACGNFYTCNKVVQVANLSAEWACQGTSAIQLVRVSGGAPPYTYFCYPRTGAPRSSTTGSFTGITECRDSVVVKDACGAYYSQIISCNNGGGGLLTISVPCTNATLGTAAVTASGGTPPYSYRENASSRTSPNGQFTGLPNSPYYEFLVTDACGKTESFFTTPLKAKSLERDCAWGIRITTNQQRKRASEPNFTDFSHLPVTYKCFTCTPVITKVDATGNALNIGSFPNVGDSQRFEVTNGCGEKDTIDVEKAGCVTSDCNNNLFVVNNTTIGGTTTFTLKTAAGVLVATNTTGQFTNVPDGKYKVTCSNPNGIPQNITYDYELKIRLLSPALARCESIEVATCPQTVSGSIKLVNVNTRALVGSNQTGVFTGLPAATNFIVYAYNTQGVAVDSLPVSTVGINDFDIEQTCTSIRVLNVQTVADPQNRPITYTLRNSAGAVVATNATGIFNGLALGNYTVTVSHPICGSLTTGINLAVGTISCIKPTFRVGINSCQFAWNVTFLQSGRITGGPDNTNTNNTLNAATGEYTINQLRPGNYVLTNTCGTFPFILPPNPVNLTVKPVSTCPTNGKITISGAYSRTKWNLITQPYQVCADSNDVLQVYNESGTSLIEQKEVIADSTTFYNFTAGASYRIYYKIRNKQGVLSCPLDTILVTMPFYTRPDLVASFGAVCNSGTASIILNVANGNPPFTYTLVTGATTRPPVTISARSYTFANLPQGAYTFRVSDTCGISSDYSSAVGALSFTPTATRFCNGCLKLEVPAIGNATYSWKRGTTTVGTTATINLCNAPVAATYTVVVTVGACVYSTSVAVAALTNPLTANAGVDFATLNSTANLAATLPAAGTSGVWTQIAPSSGTTVFASPNLATSSITVSTNPGIYTYVWSVSADAGGCVATDTVRVAIQSCTSIPILNAAAAIIAPTACGLNGSATATASGGVAPYTYKWSYNNITTQTASLPFGTYTVTVEDASPCGNPVIKTVVIPKGASSPITRTVNKTICQGGSYTFLGQVYTNAGSFVKVLTNAAGCDTARVTLNLSILSPTNQTITKNICPSETVSFNNKLYNTTGTFKDTLQSSSPLLCDSIFYTLNIVSPPTLLAAQTRTICPGDTVVVNGNRYYNAGVYPDNFKYRGRTCDSLTLTTTVQFLQASSAAQSFTICKNDSIIFNNRVYKTAGTAQDTLRAFRGCDSVYTAVSIAVTTVQIIPTSNATICNYLPRGDVQTLTISGTAPYTYAWTNGLPAQSFQNCVERGIYTVTVTDNRGCTASTSFPVVYNDLQGCIDFNAGISPNGDGKNDTWEIPCLIGVPNKLEIYNRWGQLVYEKLDYKGDFGGVYNGETLPDGVYYYILAINGVIPNYELTNYALRKGTITILRAVK